MTGHEEGSIFFLSQGHPQLTDVPGAGMEGTCICLEKCLFLVSTKALRRPAVILPRNISAASTSSLLPCLPAISHLLRLVNTFTLSGKDVLAPETFSNIYSPENQPPFLQSSKPSVPLPLIPVGVPISPTRLYVSEGSLVLSTGPRQELSEYLS